MLINGRDVRIDPWAVEYGAETPGAATTEEAGDEQVDIGVEQTQWREVMPRATPPSGPLAFVDGVRRIEARLVITAGLRVLHGAIGSHGVGVVHVNDGRAEFGEYRIGRALIFGGGEHPGFWIASGLGPDIRADFHRR